MHFPLSASTHFLVLQNREEVVAFFTGIKFSECVLQDTAVSWCVSLQIGMHPAGATCTTNKTLWGFSYQRLLIEKCWRTCAMSSTREVPVKPPGLLKAIDLNETLKCSLLAWLSRGHGNGRNHVSQLVSLSQTNSSCCRYSFNNPIQSCYKKCCGMLHATSVERSLIPESHFSGLSDFFLNLWSIFIYNQFTLISSYCL